VPVPDSARSFRFGLTVGGAPTRQELQDLARDAEARGIDAVVVPDHLVDGLMSPFVAMTSMAEATTTLRVGTLVLNNDFRHPALLAREAATLDLVSEGRVELGIGAGHSAPEYDEIGMRFDRASVRVERLEESVAILRRLFDGETVTTTSAHYQLREHLLFPARRPALLVGGNGDRVLRLAGTYADIVGFAGLGRTRPDGYTHDAQWADEQIDAKVAIVRDAATGRAEVPVFNALVQHIEITNDRRSVAERIAAVVKNPVDTMLTAPYMLIGTIEEIVEQLHRARERWGFSYFVTRDLEPTAQVIQALEAA
jgi:probable F420-dependent oxidoreductase